MCDGITLCSSRHRLREAVGSNGMVGSGWGMDMDRGMDGFGGGIQRTKQDVYSIYLHVAKVWREPSAAAAACALVRLSRLSLAK